MKRKSGHICVNCGHDRFKTAVKNKKWACRKCGAVVSDARKI